MMQGGELFVKTDRYAIATRTAAGRKACGGDGVVTQWGLFLRRGAHSFHSQSLFLRLALAHHLEVAVEAPSNEPDFTYFR